MNRLGPHRLWLTAFCGALVLLASADPLLRAAQANYAQTAKTLAAEKQRLEKTITQLRHDAAMAEKLGREINTEEIAIYLTPVDRRLIAAGLEPLAAASRLTRFTYTLSPEQQYKTDPPAPDADGLAQSSLTMEADAPHDGDAYDFISRLISVLPGRARLRRFSIDRIQTDGNAPLTAANVRMSASIDWLANASKKGEGR